MSDIGLSHSELVGIIKEGMTSGEGYDHEKLSASIANAIIANNDAIRSRITKEVSRDMQSDLTRAMRSRGMK